MERPRFSLLLGKPLPSTETLPVVDIGLGVALSWKTQVPGGDVGGSVGLIDDDVDPSVRRRAYLSSPVDTMGFAHVQVLAGSTVVSEGRITEDELPAGRVQGFEYEGYGIAAASDQWLPLPSTALTTSGRILLRAVTSGAPLLAVKDPDSFVDPNVQHSESEYDGATVADMAIGMAREGGGPDSVPWIYLVYDREITFVPYAAPAEPTYLIPLDDSVRLRRRYGGMYSHMAMRYANAEREQDQRTLELMNPLFEHEYGFVRKTLLSASAETATAANQFVSTALNEASRPEIVAELRRDYTRGLELAGGGERPVWLVRAGEWVEVLGIGTLLIEQTNFDARTGALSVTLGRPTFNRLTTILAKLIESDEAMRRKYDPTTQSRWRF